MRPEDVDAELVEKAARAEWEHLEESARWLEKFAGIEPDPTPWDTLSEASRDVHRDRARHALAAVLPEIQAQALRDHAERRNQIHWTHSCFKPECANCREVRLRQEERDSLLRAAARLTAKTEEPTDA